MCRVDDAERCDFWQTSTHKARKSHHCAECRRTIQPGESYLVQVYKSDGSFGCDRACSHCQAAMGWLVRECGGYLTTAVLEDLVEHWEEAGIRTRELAALIWGMRRKWRRRDGKLMPVPATLQEQP